MFIAIFLFFQSNVFKYLAVTVTGSSYAIAHLYYYDTSVEKMFALCGKSWVQIPARSNQDFKIGSDCFFANQWHLAMKETGSFGEELKNPFHVRRGTLKTPSPAHCPVHTAKVKISRCECNIFDWDRKPITLINNCPFSLFEFPFYVRQCLTNFLFLGPHFS